MPLLTDKKTAAAANLQMASIEARVTRADGRVEEHGVVAYYNRNPWLMWKWKIYQWLRLRRAGRIHPGASQ